MAAAPSHCKFYSKVATTPHQSLGEPPHFAGALNYVAAAAPGPCHGQWGIRFLTVAVARTALAWSVDFPAAETEKLRGECFESRPGSFAISLSILYNYFKL